MGERLTSKSAIRAHDINPIQQAPTLQDSSYFVSAVEIHRPSRPMELPSRKTLHMCQASRAFLVFQPVAALDVGLSLALSVDDHCGGLIRARAIEPCHVV